MRRELGGYQGEADDNFEWGNPPKSGGAATSVSEPCVLCPHRAAMQTCVVCGCLLCAVHESGYCLDCKPVKCSDDAMPDGSGVGMSDYDWME